MVHRRQRAVNSCSAPACALEGVQFSGAAVLSRSTLPPSPLGSLNPGRPLSSDFAAPKVSTDT